jgi:hypothetical protein
LYSIDIEHFEAFLKQQKKEAKNSSKQTQQVQETASALSGNGAEDSERDEDLPDVDPSHEQLNLPPNSLTLWRIIPKLEYGGQVRFGKFLLDSHAGSFYSSTTISPCLPWH